MMFQIELKATEYFPLVIAHEGFEDLSRPPNHTEIYAYGRVGAHISVSACLPAEAVFLSCRTGQKKL